MTSIIIYTDGGSRGNPGQAAVGAIVTDLDGNILHEHGECIGFKTNNDAEYGAFAHSLEWVTTYTQATSLQNVEWRLDSMLVVQQLNKKWKMKEPRLKSIADKIWETLQDSNFTWSIGYVPREKNSLADALVNKALDTAGF